MIRKYLSTSGLYKLLNSSFEQVEDHRSKNINYELKDVLSAGLALFTFKYSSLASFLESASDIQIGSNIKSLFKIKNIPSDTQFRDILDPLDYEQLRKPYDEILREMQRGRELEKFTVLGGLYPISLDGTEYFSSSKVQCPCCLKKKLKGKDDEYIYHHQMLGAAITHPDYKQVIPLFPEPIKNSDGDKKNDCERNSSKRWLKNFRSHHSKMRALIIEDSLASNAPHIEALNKYDCRYILGAKEDDHKYLFEQFKLNSKNNLTGHHEVILYTGEKIKKKTTRTYEYINQLELNHQSDLKVNMMLFKEKVEYIGKPPKNKKSIISDKKWSWVTDIKITDKNQTMIVRTAKRRWAIENETFKTLKNTTNYNIEHSYGHGTQNLAINFALLCILAFLTDQIQEIVSSTFKGVLEKLKTKKRMWNMMRSAIEWINFTCWEQFHDILNERFSRDTS
jgi:hypothetical protein